MIKDREGFNYYHKATSVSISCSGKTVHAKSLYIHAIARDENSFAFARAIITNRRAFPHWYFNIAATARLAHVRNDMYE